MGEERARIRIYVKPRSSREAIEGWQDGALVVRLNAPPVEGAANEALVRFLARQLGISRSSVRVVSGEKSRRKVVQIEGLSPQQVMEALS